MAIKNVLPPFHLIVAQSMAASITSTPVNIQYLDNVSIQVIFTDTPTGVFSIQISLDYVPNINTGTWTPLSLPSSAPASGVAGNILFDLNELSFPWMRVVYTRTSGTGTLDAYISGKAN